jgi:hypothetical protein
MLIEICQTNDRMYMICSNTWGTLFFFHFFSLCILQSVTFASSVPQTQRAEVSKHYVTRRLSKPDKYRLYQVCVCVCACVNIMVCACEALDLSLTIKYIYLFFFCFFLFFFNIHYAYVVHFNA